MKLRCRLAPSTCRYYPNSDLPVKRLATVDIAKNEHFSFQAVMRADEATRVRVSLEGPDNWQLRVRRVGFVPVPHHNTPVLPNPLDTDGLGHIPGFSPDPLFDEQEMLLPQEETNAFWFSIIPAPDAKAGKVRLTVTVQPLDAEEGNVGRAVRTSLNVNVYNIQIQPRKDFNITHWFYVDCLIDWYKTDLFDEKFWKIVEAYFRNIVAHGQDTVYVPVFTPPLDGVKRPSQLLRVTRKAPDAYSFNWTDVKRYIELAKNCGVTHFEWTHPFTQWGVRNAIRIYEGQGRDEVLLWPPETAATSDTYRKFLSQYLPALKRFLDREKILETSFFHVSDEPHGEEMLANYKAARALLRQFAPWMRCMDALSQIEFAREPGLVDMPVPSISCALQFQAEGIESWCYYCCGPRGEFLNRLMDTPLAKIAMHGFLFYRWPFKGFLHWGYNYWCERQKRNLVDPFTTSDGKSWPLWVYGDSFVVYPGENGPIDSIRWEIFAEALQDYALLQTLGIERDDKIFAPIKSFSDFPKDSDWRTKIKAKIYRKYASS